ncbi:FUSC family protein [Arthrobacter dokdonensis]|uniref:FUSC family protein n=1 Tax=Arthrobacter dokdonellae TaxID=2211210 RepID=UPI001D1310EC|nr:FUSC family protein [Arthrobacter dokdonellae]
MQAVAATFKKSLRLDFSQSDPVVAARNAFGVGIVLVIGVASGNFPVAVFGAVGALFAAFADRPGSYRLRFARMAGTSVAAGIGGGLSVLCAHSLPLSLLLVAVFSFTTGMLLSLGLNVAQVGIAGTAVAIVLNRFPMPLSGALGIAAAITAAGLLQSFLAIAGWPLHRHAPERAVLADLYAGLAQRTRSKHPKMTAPGAGVLLTKARETITGFGHGMGPSMQSYRGLLDEAERIRLEVIALGYCLERFERVDKTAQHDAVQYFLLAAGDALDAISESLRRGKVFDPAAMDPVTAAAAALTEVMDGFTDSPTGRFASLHCRALAGQLRAGARMVSPGAVEGRVAEPAAQVGGVRMSLQAPLGTLRANLRLDSAIARHAIRLMVMVTGTDALARLLPGTDRGYWIPLMVLLLLRPDFGATLQRTSSRLVGTLIGLGIGTAATALIGDENKYALVAVIVVFVFCVRISGAPNAFFMGIWVAAYLVALLDLAGSPAAVVVLPRLLDTVVAGVLAVAATMVWPAWERAYLPARIADLLRAYRTYLLAITDPGLNKAKIDASRIKARLARSNAQASLDRTAAEPVAGQATLFTAEGVLVQSHLFVQAAMVIDAARLSLRAAQHPVDDLMRQLAPFIADCAATLQACESAIVGGAAPRGVVSLRASYVGLKDSMEKDPIAVETVQVAVLDATDRIANSLDTMAHLLRDRGTRQEPAAA